MTRRLTADRQGKAAPVLSIRLTEALAADIERVRVELTAAVPAGLAVSPSDAVRVLLTEALAARLVASQRVQPAAAIAPPRIVGRKQTKADARPPCERCGEGVWNACPRCSSPTRVCGCVLDREGVCEICHARPAVSSSPSLDSPPSLLVAPRRPDAPTVRARWIKAHAEDPETWGIRPIAARLGGAVSRSAVGRLFNNKGAGAKTVAAIAELLDAAGR